MDSLHVSQVFAWAVVHGLGCLAAWALRLRLSQHWEAAAMSLFSVCLLAIAWLTICSFFVDAFRWVFSGATLGAMLIAAVYHHADDSVDPVLARFASSDAA